MVTEAYNKLVVFQLRKARDNDDSNGTRLDTLDPDREA